MKKEKELAYYLTLFKIEGHSTWRVHVSGHKKGFIEEWNNGKNGKHPKLVDTRVFLIDRLTGEMSAI